MQDFEKLGAFYLGREYDLAQRQPLQDAILYDSRDLVTHAVVIGMTGSGKTGLAISLIEEAAIDGIPAIVIDPKGDLGNLMLTFPELRAEDFEPWVNEEDARRHGISRAQHASAQADLWREGLAKWGQTGERIRTMREKADFALYTPASDAGTPVSLLKSFAAPSDAVLDDRELLRDRISATATSLLALAGIEGDPVQSREHILLSMILDAAWRQGRELDLACIIQQIQQPPFSRVGVLDVDSFYSAKDRFALAMSLNNLLASPGLEAWLEGDPIDIDRFLYTPSGKPRISIFSIAHLNDAERMFFVALLLNQVVSWMRAQSGTSSLRALVYMDEIFGYFPPVANPPSKLPLLTLLKQARAFGLGVVLATQNPVDLDYKGLANAGTWFIGRLQTERDKMRVLDGLEGAAATAGGGFDRRRMEQTLAALGNRIFLLNNVHEDRPVVFETRWALSYLRGPLTRTQIRQLTGGAKPGAAPLSSAPAASAGTPPAAAAAPRIAASEEPAAANARPVVPPEIPQVFLPVQGGAEVVYHPKLLGAAQVRIFDAKSGIDETKTVMAVTPIEDETIPVQWENAAPVELDLNELQSEPDAWGCFAPLPRYATKPGNYKAWSRDFINWIAASESVDLLRSPSLKLVSRPGESEREFRVRLRETAREQRDEEMERLRQRYAPKLRALEDRIRRARQMLAREAQQAEDYRMQSAVNIGTSLLGALFGRKTLSRANAGRAGSAMRSMGRAQKEEQDVERAHENLGALEQQFADLEAEFEAETRRLPLGMDPGIEALESVAVRPKKTNITVKLMALAWAPADLT